MANIKIYDAAALNVDEWHDLQALQRNAFGATLDRSQEEIDALVGWDDPVGYHASHVDPNSEVGKRFNANQSYSRTRVAIATEAGELVGFAYAANNVSGATKRERIFKQLSVVKNYLWLREVAVSPDFQRRGVALELGRSILQDAMPLQPPTTYIWTDVIGFLQGSLEGLGFVATGEQEVQVFGEGISPIRQVRMQAPSVRSVLGRMQRG